MSMRGDGEVRALAVRVTRRASRQSYLTIRWLADRRYRDDAFALYAYFRWLDDEVDEHLSGRECLALVARQRGLLAAPADRPAGAVPAEGLLARLLLTPAGGRRSDADGAHRSVEAMLAVMEFDARRRWRPVRPDELDAYTHQLAVAVTEALHHCIGHGCGAPHDGSRYVAVTGAHVAHMLRDLRHDVAAGYLNLPADLLRWRGAAPALDVDDPAVREWVRGRVAFARACFDEGRACLARVESARCRLAGHAYIARFEWVLDAIERDGYRLRDAYPERSTWRGGLAVAAAAIRSATAPSGGAGAARPAVGARGAR